MLSLLYIAARVLVTGLLVLIPTPAENAYVGAQVCATCHPSIAPLQSQSRHARTWRSVGKDFPNTYQVDLEGQASIVLPVHAVVGGDRFGFSSILEVDRLGDVLLPRHTLIEARFMQSARTGQKTLSPGLPPEKPVSYATAIGRVLSPTFAKKCLLCHGAPSEPYRESGIRCEHCHGPGQRHIQAVSQKSKSLEIVHPGRLPAEDLLSICARCHSGFFPLFDPRPSDLLISNQVTALRNSACYLKSGKRLTCLSCHSPHTNTHHEDPIYERTCLSCHSPAVKGSRLCAARRTTGCIPCHMPVAKGPNSFSLVDHWIHVAERPMPDGIRAKVMGGTAMAERGEKEKAAQFLEGLLPTGDAEPSLHYNLALVYEELGRTEDALKSYQKAITLEPDLVAAHINLGSLFLAQKKLDEAIVRFQRAVEINPLEVSAHYNLAVAFQMRNDPKAMQRELQLVVAIDPRLRKTLQVP